MLYFVRSPETCSQPGTHHKYGPVVSDVPQNVVYINAYFSDAGKVISTQPDVANKR